MRRSANPQVYLVFDLEAGRFYLLGENRLGAGAVENEFPTLVSFLERVVRGNVKPTKLLKFAILTHRNDNAQQLK